MLNDAEEKREDLLEITCSNKDNKMASSSTPNFSVLGLLLSHPALPEICDVKYFP